MDKKKIGIIGDTGSVGSSGVEVVSANSDLFETVFVTAHQNMQGLEKAKNLLNAKYAVLTSSPENHSQILDIIKKEMVDIVLFAAAGVSVVRLVYDIVKSGTHIALANKESIFFSFAPTLLPFSFFLVYGRVFVNFSIISLFELLVYVSSCLFNI